MFGSGFEDIGFILFLAFLIFGPQKLPEIARVLGKGMAELRRARDEMKFSLEEELRNLELDQRHLTEDFTNSLDVGRYDAIDVEAEAEPSPAYGHDSPEPTHDEP
ncbi:MAG: twin-arginine translocase TatA/TatE family subunit [Terriglobia bacterium]